MAAVAPRRANDCASRSRLALLITLLAGCGRIGFGSGGTEGDGGGIGNGDGRNADGRGPDALQISGCPTTTILSDDFADGTVDPAWTLVNSTGNYTVSETGGVLSVAFPASAAVDSRAGYRQTASQSLVGTCAIAELTMVPGGSTTSYAYLRLGAPLKFVEVVVQGGQVIGRFNNSGTSGTNGSAPYNPVAHRFLRIRESSGNYVMEVGPSLSSFTTLGSAGGGVVNPSPTSLEIGGSVTQATANGAGTVNIERVIFVGP